MSTTPGLTVTADAVIRRERRLPLRGRVLVRVGEEVLPETVVARAELPGPVRSVRLADLLGVPPAQATEKLLVPVGQAVTRGTLLGENRGLFGLFRSEARAPCDGLLESLSPISGRVALREAPRPVAVTAYIAGRVAAVRPGEGVTVEARGALLQGIFGVGGERHGRLVNVASPDVPLDEAHIHEAHRGAVVAGGCRRHAAALARAAEVGAVGVVSAAIRDEDLTAFVGREIGVAITGRENVPLTLVLTEGFGELRMAARTARLLESLEEREVSLNGATQIRAGVQRPEVVCPLVESGDIGTEGRTDAGAGRSGAGEAGPVLAEGAPVRLVRAPYFGRLGRVDALPPEPQRIPTGAVVRVLEAELEDGRRVVVPRANVELIVE
jgi:hypothetical protein